MRSLLINPAYTILFWPVTCTYALHSTLSLQIRMYSIDASRASHPGLQRYTSRLHDRRRTRTAAVWGEAADSQFSSTGRALDRAFSDRALSRFASTTDMPCAVFAQELVEAYPEIKGISILLRGL